MSRSDDGIYKIPDSPTGGLPAYMIDNCYVGFIPIEGRRFEKGIFIMDINEPKEGPYLILDVMDREIAPGVVRRGQIITEDDIFSETDLNIIKVIPVILCKTNHNSSKIVKSCYIGTNNIHRIDKEDPYGIKCTTRTFKDGKVTYKESLKAAGDYYYVLGYTASLTNQIAKGVYNIGSELPSINLYDIIELRSTDYFE
jgi:hypothetical protein